MDCIYERNRRLRHRLHARPGSFVPQIKLDILNFLRKPKQQRQHSDFGRLLAGLHFCAAEYGRCGLKQRALRALQRKHVEEAEDNLIRRGELILKLDHDDDKQLELAQLKGGGRFCADCGHKQLGNERIQLRIRLDAEQQCGMRKFEWALLVQRAVIRQFEHRHVRGLLAALRHVRWGRIHRLHNVPGPKWGSKRHLPVQGGVITKQQLLKPTVE